MENILQGSRRLSAVIAAIAFAMAGMNATGAAAPALHSDCSGALCGADGNSYTGHGVGIWTYRNDRNRAAVLDVALEGLRGNTVTLVFSNSSSAEAILDGDLAGRRPPPSPPPPSYAASKDPLPAMPYPSDTSGEARTWKVPQVAAGKMAPPRAFASRLRASAMIDGFHYRIWVADDDWTPHMQDQLPRLAAMLFGVPGYPGLLPQYLAVFPAAPWGTYQPHPANATLLSSTTREVDFVIAPNGAGNLQFFDSSQVGEGPDSNRALVMFVGSEALACNRTSICLDLSRPELAFATTNTLLHEFTHLVHYYQRELGTRTGAFDRWLKEAIASSQGFTLALSRFPSTSPLSFEIAPWFGGKYACSLTSAEGEAGTSQAGSCAQNYYSSGQAFLLYLVGQYGSDFYSKLLAANGSGVDAVDAAIRACGGPGFDEAFRRWGGMLALLPKDAPAGYGYPGTRVGGFVLPAIDGAAYAAQRRLPAPSHGPLTLAPYSHWPLVDASQRGSYRRHIVVPAGVAVTVYVQ
jgi:hypothetical protein